MSGNESEFPRDLRALFDGAVEESDGSLRVLYRPDKSYHNLTEAQKELERDLADPNIHSEDAEFLRDKLELVKRGKEEIKRRIADAHKPRYSKSSAKDSVFPKIDHGAKNKMEKLMADVDAGRYDPSRMTKIKAALFWALNFFQKNGRMPSHGELKIGGFNDQQATDLGKWLKDQNHPHPDTLFSPLHQPKRGPKKK